MISIVGDSVHRTSTGNRNCAKCRTVGKSPRGRFQRYLAFKVDPFFEIVYSCYPWPPPSRGPGVAIHKAKKNVILSRTPSPETCTPPRLARTLVGWPSWGIRG